MVLSKTVALVFLFLSVIINGIGNFLLKGVAMEKVTQVTGILLTKNFWVSVSLLTLGFFFYITSLKKIELSIAYPLAASLTTVFIVILSSIFLKEKLDFYQFLGIGLALGGMRLLVK